MGKTKSLSTPTIGVYADLILEMMGCTRSSSREYAGCWRPEERGDRITVCRHVISAFLIQMEQTNDSSVLSTEPFNKHYLITHNVSPIFTGRSDISKLLEETCLPPKMADASGVQKRCVLYGLGGSGKTQVCLKFAQDHREKHVPNYQS